ncbi:TetR/AcrR family transcriptional regulator [Streptomyces sp. NRRL B-3229]|uniref:TetR/AcrR family transcriptional regulator n=1 Tax=Streptomyces sp. NRRL B-3229 TaxID=1463836 RepID=UPI0004C01BA0|nr:TetR/AcrR family transcriptional regulator [Streptomyces sp. NRRL B-3229]
MVAEAPGRAGRPPLTERRREMTRGEIAEEALRLFVTQGVAATTAEDIAVAAGISTRTLWRYFRSKEECVRPLLAAGIELATECLRAHRRKDGSLADVTVGVDGSDALSARPVEALRDLVRLSRDEPGLRAVWLDAHFDAEAGFARLIAEDTGRSEQDLAVRVEAGMLNAALRIAVEDWALRADRPSGPSLGATLTHALHMVAESSAASARTWLS